MDLRVRVIGDISTGVGTFARSTRARQANRFAERPEFCDQYARDRGRELDGPLRPTARLSRQKYARATSQSAPILQQWSEQVCRSFEAGQAMKP